MSKKIKQLKNLIRKLKTTGFGHLFGYYYNGNLEGTSWTGVPMYADGEMRKTNFL